MINYLMYSVKRFIQKIKDYDRLEHDYSMVLDYSTNGKMTNTNYNLDSIYTEIDISKSELYYGIVKEDIENIIEKGGTIEDITNYINEL